MPWKVAAVTPLGEVVKGLVASGAGAGGEGLKGSALPALAGSVPAAATFASAEGLHVGSVGTAVRDLAADATLDPDELTCDKVARAGGRLGGANVALSPPVLTGADRLAFLLIAGAAVAAVGLARAGRCTTRAKRLPRETLKEGDGAKTLDLDDTSGPRVTSGAVPDAANALGGPAAVALAAPGSDPGVPWRTEDTSAAQRQTLAAIPAAIPPAWMGVKWS